MLFHPFSPGVLMSYIPQTYSKGIAHATRRFSSTSVNTAALPPHFKAGDRVLSVDIDGTIADVTKRKLYALQFGPDASRVFYEVFLAGEHYHMDDPVIASREFLHKYVSDLRGKIIYLSGRREGTEGHTQEWLTRHSFPDGHIVHRRKGLQSAQFKTHWIRAFLSKGLIVDAHVGDRLEDDGGAAKNNSIRFIHIVDHAWPTFPSPLTV
jgi:predicted secreted acid phosphatase